MQASTSAGPELTPRETFLLEYLAAHEAACPACGYNVHALVAPRCPECGLALELQITAEGQGSRAWILLLCGTALGAAVGLFCLILITDGGFPGPLQWQILFVYFLANVPMPLVAIFARRRFTRLRVSSQWIYALATAGATMVMIVRFIAKVARW